jgi:hypothetical protein
MGLNRLSKGWEFVLLTAVAHHASPKSTYTS